MEMSDSLALIELLIIMAFAIDRSFLKARLRAKDGLIEDMKEDLKFWRENFKVVRTNDG